MRLSLRSGNVGEWLALHAGVVPEAAGQAWGGMALSGILVAAVRTGLIERLAREPATAAELAAGLDLDPVPAGLLLECLRSSGHVARQSDHQGGRYRLTRRSRRWLDPESPYSIAQFVAATGDYWDWWSRMDETVRSGPPVGHHHAPPGDPYWRRYITGQFELARLSADEVAGKLKPGGKRGLPAGSRSLLDIGGGHGWYSARLCHRNPGLTATVLDLPGSAAIGREIIAGAGMADRVRFRDGDATRDDLGDGYDAVLCFNLVHHLTLEQITGLFARVHAALRPGGVLAVLDGFTGSRNGVTGARRQLAQADILSLFVYLSSGSRVHTQAELCGWLRDAGFAPPRRTGILRIPGQALYTARTPPAGLCSRSLLLQRQKTRT
ncbi:MAG TPA: class I SAM-dependent methyltransferase [Trebonia sp.]